MLHARAGLAVLNILKTQWPELWAELLPYTMRMIDAVDADEKAWSAHLFSEGRQLIGLNKTLLDAYSDHRTSVAKYELGLINEPLPLPLPYMLNWMDSSRVQIAAQEMQLTSYLLNSVKAESDEAIAACLNDLKGLV